MDKSLLQDALQLCDNAFRTKEQNEAFKKGRREISIGNIVKGSYGILPDESVLYYKHQATSELLRQAGVINYSWWADNHSAAKEAVQGYYKVIFDYDRAREWMKKTISQFTKAQKHRVVIPEGEDHIYENGIFVIALQNGSIDTIDLSKSPIARPVFDTLYTLYRNSSQPLFSKKELLDVYAQITNDAISWVNFTKMVSDIKKRIKNKPAFNKRVILRFDKKHQSYEFTILPLSSSDE